MVRIKNGPERESGLVKGPQMGLKTCVTLIALGLAVAGCQSRSLNSIAPTGQPQRLPSAPVEPVQTAELPQPADPAAIETSPREASAAPTAPAIADESPQTTEPAPAPSGEPVTREGVSGAWIVASDNPDCRMILAFTKWSGGYRAATKRCNSTELSSVSAWDVKGQQVVLMDSSGNTLARLYQSANERYDGTTNSGQPISFTR